MPHDLYTARKSDIVLNDMKDRFESGQLGLPESLMVRCIISGDFEQVIEELSGHDFSAVDDLEVHIDICGAILRSMTYYPNEIRLAEMIIQNCALFIFESEWLGCLISGRFKFFGLQSEISDSP